MDSGFLELLKGLSPITVIVVAVLVIAVLSWARRAIRADNREDLGLKEGESLDEKIGKKVTEGFEASVNPITTAIQSGVKEISSLKTEVLGTREALADHKVEIDWLKLQVAALTGQVGGLPAVDALRARIERRKKIAAAKQDPETPPTSEGTP